MTEKEMEKYWKELNQAYMTEESDDPDDPDVIILHKLNWRSQSKLRVSLCLCITLFVYHSVCVSLCLCVTLFVCHSVCVSLCLCITLFVCHSVCVSLCLCITLFLYHSVFVSLCMCHSVVCTHVSLCVSTLGLNKYIQVLDGRKSSSKLSPGLVARKRRVIGIPSSDTPPTHAPTWAIKS